MALDGQNRLLLSPPTGLPRPIAWRERLGNLLDRNRTEPALVAGLTKGEAEDLLDWLEANGYQQRELSYNDRQGFVVQYK